MSHLWQWFSQHNSSHILKVDFQAGERVGALEALYSLNFGVQRPPLSQILKINLRGRKMPLDAYDRRCKIRNSAWLKEILRCHSRGCDKKEVIDTKKTKTELKSMANYISSQEGQYLFSASEISKILGVCKDTTREICSNLEPATFGRVKRYFIIDILEFMYNQNK